MNSRLEPSLGARAQQDPGVKTTYIEQPKAPRCIPSEVGSLTKKRILTDKHLVAVSAQ